MSNPSLPADRRQKFVNDLMAARRAVGLALRADNSDRLAEARKRVDAAKVALGERGDVWWTDGAPDFNRRMAKATPYRDWFAALSQTSK